MKDYEEKVLNIMDSAKDNIRTQLDKAYKSGYEDAKSELGKNAIDLAHAESDRAYQQGLEDAWEAAKKIMRMDIIEKDAIFAEFGKSTYSVIMDMSASEAISKIKKYEEQQEQDTEIKVGDEVITEFGTKGVVITDTPSGEGTISVWLPTCTHVQMYPVEDLSKTGRHFDQINKVFAEMRGDKEC